MHVAELVNLLAPMVGPDKTHLGYQDFGLIHRRMRVEAGRAGVADVGEERRAHFMRHRRAGQPQVADFLAGQPVVLLLELETPFPDDVADRRNRVRRGERHDHMLARQFDLLAGRDAVQVADHAAAVEAVKDQQQATHVLQGIGREINVGRRHAHHAPAGDVDRQGGDVIEVSMREQPGRRAHEVPRLGAEVEADLQFGDAPVGLHRGGE